MRRESLYQGIMDLSPDSILVIHPENRTILMCNRQAAVLHGFDSPDEIIGRASAEFVIPEDVTIIRNAVEKAIQEGVVRNVELRMPRRNSQPFLGELNLACISDDAGQPRLLIGIARDISHRHALEKALKESESFYRALINTCPDIIAVFDLDLNLTMINQQGLSFLGWDAADPSLPLTAYDSVAPEFLQQIRSHREQVLASGKILNEEYVLIAKDGQRIPMEVHASRILDDRDVPIAFMSVARDVSEKKRMEAQTLQAREEEHHRIAEDLHDGVCSQLAGVAFLAESLRRELAREDNPHAVDLEQIHDLVRSAVTEIRSVAEGLSPVPPRPDGLMIALEHLARSTYEHLKVECIFACEEEFLLQKGTVANNLYRIAQEAIHNAVQHGQATRITAKLVRRSKRGILEIEDNGRGIDQTKTSHGRGIDIMRHRASLIEAHLEIRSIDPHGTKVSCSFPLS